MQTHVDDHIAYYLVIFSSPVKVVAKRAFYCEIKVCVEEKTCMIFMAEISNFHKFESNSL